MARQQYDQVIFNDVADQYIKGQDIIAYFTVLTSQQIDPNRDQIGLIRVGCVDPRKCLTYAPVKFNPSTNFGSGTARFSSLLLPEIDDEFYQFCYIHQKTKNLGSSIPFQLNSTSDGMDQLFNSFADKPNELIAFDHGDDVVVITASPQANLRRSSMASGKVSNESDQLRSQLASTMQFTKDQATQIIQLERCLIQANESAKKSQEQQCVLEQQLRDLQLTSEKRQRSVEGQLKQSSNQQLILEQQLRDSKLTAEKYQRSTQGLFTKQVQHQDQTGNSNEQSLKSSFNASEKRCLRHQQNEIDLKRQLVMYQTFVGDLQREIEHLNKRLSIRFEEYND